MNAGNLANHSPETAQHLTIYNHRRRKDWKSFAFTVRRP